MMRSSSKGVPSKKMAEGKNSSRVGAWNPPSPWPASAAESRFTAFAISAISCVGANTLKCRDDWWGCHP